MNRWFAQARNPHSWTIFLLSLALSASGCSGGGTVARKPHVAVVVKALDSEFWLQVKKGVESAARDHPEIRSEERRVGKECRL